MTIKSIRDRHASALASLTAENERLRTGLANLEPGTAGH